MKIDKKRKDFTKRKRRKNRPESGLDRKQKIITKPKVKKPKEKEREKSETRTPTFKSPKLMLELETWIL